MIELERTLKNDEKITERSKQSYAAIAVMWLSIPAVFLFVFLFVVLPPIIRILVSKELNEALQAQLGIDALSFQDAVASAFPHSFVNGLLIAAASLLAAVWLIWACIMTQRCLGYELAFTDLRVIGKAKELFFEAPFSKVKNAFIERSIWGKLFGYGNVTVYAEDTSSCTFRNIKNPEYWRQKLLSLS